QFSRSSAEAQTVRGAGQHIAIPVHGLDWYSAVRAAPRGQGGARVVRLEPPHPIRVAKRWHANGGQRALAAHSCCTEFKERQPLFLKTNYLREEISAPEPREHPLEKQLWHELPVDVYVVLHLRLQRCAQ